MRPRVSARSDAGERSRRDSPASSAVAACTECPSRNTRVRSASGEPSPRTAIATQPRREIHQEVADREVVEVPLQKCAHGIIRRADDRLLVHVEAGVDDRRDARQLGDTR